MFTIIVFISSPMTPLCFLEMCLREPPLGLFHCCIISSYKEFIKLCINSTQFQLLFQYCICYFPYNTGAKSCICHTKFGNGTQPFIVTFPLAQDAEILLKWHLSKKHYCFPAAVQLMIRFCKEVPPAYLFLVLKYWNI